MNIFGWGVFHRSPGGKVVEKNPSVTKKTPSAQTLCFTMENAIFSRPKRKTKPKAKAEAEPKAEAEAPGEREQAGPTRSRGL